MNPAQALRELEEPKRRTTLSRLGSSRSLLVGGTVVLSIVVMGVFASVIAPFDPIKANATAALQSPTWDNWMGTDNLGRDVLSRVIWGIRPTLVMGFLPATAGAIIGTAIGMPIGYRGGWLDLALMRFIDVAMAIPAILLALTLIAVMGPGLRSTVLALALAGLPFYIRITRTLTVAGKEQRYVKAAVATGASDTRIMLQHILPQLLPSILVIATLHVAAAILAGAALSFLGLGLSPPTPEWGTMIQQGKEFISRSWWMAFFPGVALVITVFGVNLTGDGIRDVMDPRSTHR